MFYLNIIITIEIKKFPVLLSPFDCLTKTGVLKLNIFHFFKIYKN